MLKSAAVLLLVSLVLTPSTTSVSAGLKYSLHMETRQAANANPDPMTQMLANMMTSVFPQGGIDEIVSVSEKGTRTEQKQEFSGMPAGTVLVTRADGSTIGMNPAMKTFWKQPNGMDAAAAALQQMETKPDVKVKKTGEFETIEGMRAERVNVLLGVPLPIDPSQLPPGFPTSLSITMDVWLTDAVKSPVSSTALADTLIAKLLPDQTAFKDLNDGRFMLKQVMNMFGVELVTTVKDVVKGDVEDGLFDVPNDFKEVPPPGGGGLIESLRAGSLRSGMRQ